jgi:N-acetylmuramoyl-L-alanine amidase
MGHPAQRPVFVSLSAAIAASMAVLSAPFAPALAAPAPPVPYVVTIDPGHGGSPDDSHPERLFDPGVRALNGLVEKDLTLDIARRLRSLLQDRGVHVVMTRDSDKFVDITPRIQTANSSKSDLFVSIHLNYFGDDPAVGGSLILYPNASSGAFAKTMSATLAKRLEPVGIHGSKVMLKDNLWTTAQMPAITVEAAYLSNRAEADLLKKSTTRDALAEAVLAGLQAQDPELTRRPAEIAAYQRAHQTSLIAAAARAPKQGYPSIPSMPLMPWVPLALAAALAYVLRRQLIPVLAMVIAIIGLALGRFNPEEPEWRMRSGVRRRRSRARIFGTS